MLMEKQLPAAPLGDDAMPSNRDPNRFKIQGEIPALSLQEVLQMAAMANRNGQIQVTHENLKVCLDIEAGQVLQIQFPQGLMFGEFLIQKHALNAEQLSTILSQQHLQPKPLGRLIIEAGLLTEETLKALVAQFFCDLTVRILRWNSGKIEFVERAGTCLTRWDRPTACSISWLVLEATHRLDQWQRITGNEVRLRSVLKINRDYLSENQTVKLGFRTWKLLSLINGRRDIARILEKLGGDPYQNMQALDQMIRAGMIHESQFSLLDLIIPAKIPMDRRNSQAWYPGQFEANILYREMDGKRNLLSLAKACNLHVRRVWDYTLLLIKGGTVEIISGQREFQNLSEEI
ncbi:MAG: DUF4388 domain-containing protein [Acidobacteria bacterium]|nr:DUF4388 domain-containing protein [Acidobacteriota bacterium]